MAKQGEMVYRDVLPSGSGTQFFFARIIGCNHVGGAMGGLNEDSVAEIQVKDRQIYSTYAWEEVDPIVEGNYTQWVKGRRSSYSFYDRRYDDIPAPKQCHEDEDGNLVGMDWSKTEDGSPHPGGPGTALHQQVANLESFFRAEGVRDDDGLPPDASLRDRSYFRDFIDEGIDRINDFDYGSGGSNNYKDHPNVAGCSCCPDDDCEGLECKDIPGSTADSTKSIFAGSLAINVSEYNRYHNPASPVGSIVLMQEVEVGGEGTGVFRYMFNAPETRGTVLAKIIRAHPIGPTLPNVDDEEDPEFRMWAYEWREVEFNVAPDFTGTKYVAKQHQDEENDTWTKTAFDRDMQTAVTGFDYPVRDGTDYRVGGRRISEDPIIEVGGFTANADVEHWVSSRLGTGEVEGFDSYTFNLVTEKGLFRETIIEKLKLYQEWASTPSDVVFPRAAEAVSIMANEVRVLNSGVFGTTGDFDWDISPGATAELGIINQSSISQYPEITDEEIQAIDRYLLWCDVPRSNPLALNTCEFYNVSADNEYIDVGMRGATGNRRLVPRYVSPGVDMSRLPRFMRVQPIRPGTIVHMNFASTGFYSHPDIKFPEDHEYAGAPVPLQNRPNANPPMFTMANSIDTLDDPCAFKQLPFPFKLENVNEQFTNSIQPIQGSYIVHKDLSQPNP